MALGRTRSHGFAQKALSAAATGMQVAGTAKAIYDVGRTIYGAARVAAPFLAAAL
jgi:hypothetical protein